MKITVLGAGLVGGPMAADLARDEDFEVTAVDADQGALDRLAGRAQGVELVRRDLADPDVVTRLAAESDLVLSAVPGRLGYRTLEAVLRAGRQVVDIAFFPEDPFDLHDLAVETGATAVVDCGLAPGLSHLLVGHADRLLDDTERVLIYVGGLPERRVWPYEYKAVFSPADVIEEYTRPARTVENGALVTRPALSDPELLDVPEVGTLEAFNTDGLRTLVRTLDVPNMQEKTLRYPGHAEKISLLRASGFFDREEVVVDGRGVRPIDLTSRLLFRQWRLEEGEPDLTVMRVVVEGRMESRPVRFRYDLLDRYCPATGVHSMARTTGYAATVALRLLAAGLFPEKGVFAPEHLGRDPECVDYVLHGLAERGVRVEETVEELEPPTGGGSTGGGVSRRRVLQALLALPLVGAGTTAAAGPAAGSGPAPRSGGSGRRVVVLGAGAFGGWSALMLRRRGYEVTLVDAWGPGNARASSGGDTRVIRGMYGPDAIYTQWARRAFRLWKESARTWDRELYHPTGALWLFRGDDGYATASLPYLRDAGFEVEVLSPTEGAKRWPQVSFDGVRSVYHEREAGYLTARDACRAVVEALVREGGAYRQGTARPPRGDGSGLARVELTDGTHLEADHVVCACGPWLGGLFPELVGDRILPTRQEVFFFGPPAGPSPWDETRMPVWIDFGERIFYGVPGNLHRGFKVADDSHGDVVDPTTQERRPSPRALERAREQLRTRFPGLAAAPLLEARVCQYGNTPDGQYLIDRHPELANVWIVGGGSGHGFKLGPAVGEHVAGLVSGAAEPLDRFSLARLAELDRAESKSQLESG